VRGALLLDLLGSDDLFPLKAACGKTQGKKPSKVGAGGLRRVEAAPTEVIKCDENFAVSSPVDVRADAKLLETKQRMSAHKDKRELADDDDVVAAEQLSLEDLLSGAFTVEELEL
jgi:hypothetical protein